MKKALSLVLALVLLLSVTSVFAEEEKTTLTLWCIATESDSNRIAYEKAIPEIEEAFNVKIEWEAFENDSYRPRSRARALKSCPTSSSPGPALSAATSPLPVRSTAWTKRMLSMLTLCRTL